MRLARTVLLILPFVSIISAADPAIYVKVDSAAPDYVRDSMSTEITQALRRFPDVKIVLSDEDYRLSVTCIDVERQIQLACAVGTAGRSNLNGWRNSVKPQNPDGWKAMADAIGVTHQALSEKVYVVGVNQLVQFGRDLADSLNSDCLEIRRALNAMLERSQKQ